MVCAVVATTIVVCIHVSPGCNWWITETRNTNPSQKYLYINYLEINKV